MNVFLYFYELVLETRNYYYSFFCFLTKQSFEDTYITNDHKLKLERIDG